MTGTGELRRGGGGGRAQTLPRGRAAAGTAASGRGAAPRGPGRSGAQLPGPSGPRSRSPGPSVRPGPAPRGSRDAALPDPRCGRVRSPPLPAAPRRFPPLSAVLKPRPKLPRGPAAAARSAPGAGTPEQPRGSERGSVSAGRRRPCVPAGAAVSPPPKCGRDRLWPGIRQTSGAVVREMVTKTCLLERLLIFHAFCLWCPDQLGLRTEG